MGVEKVFRISALCVLVMFFGVLLFYREPKSAGEEKKNPTLAQTTKNFLTVISNFRFMLFLLIFSGYWIVFWQEFIAMPLYLTAYVDPHADVERILITDAAAVICLQVLISYLTRKVAPFRAVMVGTLISGVAWMVLAVHPAIWTAVASILVIALGEMIQAPRYYEYISQLAPAGQQGTYMGFAFLPIGIGSLIGGWFGGSLIHHYGEVMHQPYKVWWAITAVGLVTAVLLWIYDRIVKPGENMPPQTS
jgi:MFS family permease